MVKAVWLAQVLKQENRTNDHTNKRNKSSCPDQSGIFDRSEKVSKSRYQKRATGKTPKEEVKHNLPRPGGLLYKWHIVVRTGFPNPFFAVHLLSLLHNEKAVVSVKNDAAIKLATNPGTRLFCGSRSFSGRLYTQGRSMSTKQAFRSPTGGSSSTPYTESALCPPSRNAFTPYLD